MEIIQSTQNEKIKQLKKLQTKKGRKENNRFVVENAKIVFDSLDSGFVFESLFVTEDFSQKNQDFLSEVEKRQGSVVTVVSDQVYNSFSELVTPQGIAAVYVMPNESSLDHSQDVVYLQGISDPGNLGTMFRSAIAFDVKQFVLDEFCVDPYSSKVIQASKDAIFKIKMRKDSERKFLQEVRGGMNIVALSQKGVHSLEDISGSASSCFVFGSEAHGISEEVYTYVSQEIAIPMGTEMESLNVASASAIVFYQQFKKR